MSKKISGIAATCATALLACLLACAVVPAISAPSPSSSDSGNPDASGLAATSGRSGADASGEAGARQDEVSGGEGDRPVYEAGTVLVTLEGDVSADEAVERISHETGIRGLVLASEGPGFIKIALPEGVEVEDALSLVEGSSVVAVMSRKAERAEAYARRHGIDRWYTDAQELLDGGEA